MESSGRRIGSWAWMLVFGALLASCSGNGNDNNGGGGGGGETVLLYFGSNGDGNCSNVVVDVRLNDANAVLSRKSNGDADCDLSGVLDDKNCNVAFDEISGGDTLRVTISGCTIPAVTNLFSCEFTDADISKLSDETSAICACKKAGCDTSPPICISEFENPASCEDCDNHVDDDDNDLVDCLDPNCEHSPLCAEPTTTITTTTTLVNNTTTTTVTTTTTLPVTDNCAVTFRLNTPVTVAALNWSTNYGNADGQFVGSGTGVHCENLIGGAGAVFNDKDGQHKLETALTKAGGFAGPVDVTRCEFGATGPVAKADFDITVTLAANGGTAIVPLPAVVVGDLECVPVTPTTTTTTTIEGGGTTTTLGGGGNTTTTIEGGGDTTTTTIDGGVTTTTLQIREGFFDVHFKLATSSVPLNALQITATYTDAPGTFEGIDGAVNCTNEITGDSLFAPNDKDADKKLTVGIVALDAFAAPTNLFTCTFEAASLADVPLASQFVVHVDDASSENEGNATATIGVTVTQAHF